MTNDFFNGFIAGYVSMLAISIGTIIYHKIEEYRKNNK